MQGNTKQEQQDSNVFQEVCGVRQSQQVPGETQQHRVRCTLDCVARLTSNASLRAIGAAAAMMHEAQCLSCSTYVQCLGVSSFLLKEYVAQSIVLSTLAKG